MRSTSSSKKHGQIKPTYAKKQVFPRAGLTGQVIIHDDRNLYIAPISNLSAGGLFIEQLVNIPAGKQVKVVVKSDRLSTPIQIQGTVVRVERGGKRGLAVQFNEINADTKETIENFVFESRMETALKVA